MYSKLDIMNNIQHHNLFTQQLNEKEEYKQIVNDYTHLVTEHQHQLELIHETLCKYFKTS